MNIGGGGYSPPQSGQRNGQTVGPQSNGSGVAATGPPLPPNTSPPRIGAPPPNPAVTPVLVVIGILAVVVIVCLVTKV